MNKHGILIKEGDILNNKYKVLSHIASGGMSEVYLIEEINNPAKKWAVKIANMSSKLALKLVDETKILSELDHPNLPHVADFFSSDDYFFLVLEYIDGVTLSEYFEQNNYELPTDMVLQTGLQLCDLLHYLHNREPDPIIYRDVKPGNIMVMNDGTIKLIDFGIARKFQENRMKDTVQIGTVGFAAPEQFEKKQTDTRTDLFSLGALLYYLLSKGKYVYIAQKPIRHYQKSLSKSLENSINQLVQLEPENRLQNAVEAKELLLKAREEYKIKDFRNWNWSDIRYISTISISAMIVGYIILSFIF